MSAVDDSKVNSSAGEEPEPPRSRPARREVVDLTEQTLIGAFYLRALMRRQMRLSLVIAAIFLCMVGLQPIIPVIWAGYSDIQVGGIPLPWLVLGAFSYPVLVLLGITYVRRAEAIDDEFIDLLR